VDEQGSVWAGENSRNLAEQGLALDVAVGAQARGDAVEVAVVVTGMAAELVGPSGRKRAQNLGEGCGVELAGGGDGDGAVCRSYASFTYLCVGLEARTQATDEPDGEAPREAAVVERERPVRLEGVANGADSAAIGNLQQRARDGGKRCVCLCVSMWVTQIPARCSFSICASASRATSSALIRPSKSACTKSTSEGRKFCRRFRSGWDGVGRRDGRAVGEHDVAANAKRGVGAGDGNGVVEGGAGGHQRGGRQHSSRVQFADGAVDAAGEAEVVGVEDEARGHRLAVVEQKPGCWLSVGGMFMAWMVNWGRGCQELFRL